jgi:hypothetical protein
MMKLPRRKLFVNFSYVYIKNTTQFGEVYLEFSEEIKSMSKEMLESLTSLTLVPLQEIDAE